MAQLEEDERQRLEEEKEEKQKKNKKKKKGKPAKAETVVPSEPDNHEKLSENSVKFETTRSRGKRVDISYDPSRYDEIMSPMCVTIPHRDVLLKMMKACVGVEEIKDLWIYNQSIEDRLAAEDAKAKKKKEVTPFYLFF